MKSDSELLRLRSEIDRLDMDILDSFIKRMDVVREIAKIKSMSGLPIYNAERERDILERVEMLGKQDGAAARKLFSVIMELSRELQENILDLD